MTTQAAETDLIVSDPTGRPSFLPVSIVPVIVAPLKERGASIALPENHTAAGVCWAFGQ